MTAVAERPGNEIGIDPLRAMAASRRRLIGLTNAVEGVAALLALVWAYGLAERMVLAQELSGPGTVATRTVAWWGPSFGVTLSTSLFLVGAAGGFLGSVVQQSIVFAARAGAETLERGYIWWYGLRPVWSALLGAAMIVTVNAGLVSIGDETTSAAGVTVLVTSAVVAGLFTDQVLQRMQGVLGASDPKSAGA